MSGGTGVARTEADGTRLGGPLIRLALVMLLGGFLPMVDATIVNVGMNSFAGHFEVALTTIEWVTTGYLLAVSVSAPVAGWAVDRFGGKAVWLLALGLFLGGSALCASAWSPGALIGFRVLQGFGGGMLEPVMMTVLGREAGQRRAGKLVGLLALVLNLGPVLGPVVGGLLLQYLGWQWLFLVNLPLGLAAFVLALPLVPAGHPEADRRPVDIAGIALLCPGFAAVEYGLAQAAGGGFGATPVVAGLVLGVLLLGGYAAHALRAANPLIDIRLFASRGFAASVVVIFLAGGALFGALFLIPLYYQQVRQHGLVETGLLLAPLGLGTLLSMPVAAKLSEKAGANRLVPLGGVLVVACIGVYTQAGTTTNEAWLAACLFVFGIGFGLVGAPTVASIFRSVPPKSVSSATGSLFVVNQIGASLTVAVVALVVQHGKATGSETAVSGTFGAAFWWMCGLAAVGAVCGLGLPGRPAAPETAAEAPETARQP
ncbi:MULTISPECIES: DHA2 family efflux MFS transporter permease subunit [Actinomycetes]|uniref:DHA2 family efflux MFS transporter permease subunit n=1 Tax=Actinomycetes TaxID=1760 RepID=UPI0001B54557|nr:MULTISPECIES: DHA2 family efflux MFS transporter permease subunit [Actinomycetes]EFL07739.1 predicted protein [Streptomyces sp. AA4]